MATQLRKLSSLSFSKRGRVSPQFAFAEFEAITLCPEETGKVHEFEIAKGATEYAQEIRAKGSGYPAAIENCHEKVIPWQLSYKLSLIRPQCICNVCAGAAAFKCIFMCLKCLHVITSPIDNSMWVLVLMRIFAAWAWALVWK